MEEKFSLTSVLGVALVALIVGLTIGANLDTLLSNFDNAEKDISGWNILSKDVAFNSMDGEDRIEILVSYVAEGADPRPAWPLFSQMMNSAFSDIYARGRIECIEDCENTIEQMRMVYFMMDDQN